jgi:hypothetical protein
MSTRTVVIEGAERLEGVLHEGAGIGGAVVCHPHPLYGGSMWNDVVDAMEEGFSKAGFTTLRFNFRGVGSSTGRYDGGVGETEDLVAACHFLKSAMNACQFLKGEVSGEAPQAMPAEGVLNPNLAGRFVIAGYSFGAWVSSMALARVAGVTDLFLVAFPFSSYQTGEIRAFSGRIYLVGGSLDDISPLDDLVALHRDLKGEKRLKVIPASHFFEGHASEISEFILESFREEEG